MREKALEEIWQTCCETIRHLDEELNILSEILGKEDYSDSRISQAHTRLEECYLWTRQVVEVYRHRGR